ncbi:MAG: hypothetical protein QMD12_03610 [Candidatus Aenigmarchaeota archaeon]|nr:hypothetical protein [Candidatus Aenigmarchaeota archaeon]
MSRTFKEIEIEGKATYVLFDTGSTRSYVRQEFASEIRWKTVPFRVGLGGRIYEISEACALNCAIEGLPFDIEAHPVEELGSDEKGRKIDAIIGALAMEKWVLIPDPKTGKIDLTALRKREFTEY